MANANQGKNRKAYMKKVSMFFSYRNGIHSHIVKDSARDAASEIIEHAIENEESVTIGHVYIDGERCKFFSDEDEVVRSTAEKEIADIILRPSSVDCTTFVEFDSGTWASIEKVFVNCGKEEA